MTESENVSANNFNQVWDFIKENPKIMGLPLTDNKGIDILSVLRDIYETNKTDHKAAQAMLTMLANVLLAVVQGDGDILVEEVLVQEAMLNLDKDLKGILNENT